MPGRKRNRRRKKMRSFGILYKILTLIVVCAAIVTALTLFFKVDTITVAGESKCSDEQIISASGIVKGDNLFLLNKYAISDKILKELPAVDHINISRRLPDTLVITVTDSNCVGYIEQGGKNWIMSDKGKLVGNGAVTEADKYIKITGCPLLAPVVGEEAAFGNDDNGGVFADLKALLTALTAKGINYDVSSIDLSGASVISMRYADRFTVIMNRGADYEYKIDNMKAVIAELEDNETGIIDLTIDGTAYVRKE